MSTLTKTSRNLWILEKGKPTCGTTKQDAGFGNLLYAANPVYIDISQGRSHMADTKRAHMFGFFLDALLFSIVFIVLIVTLMLGSRHEETRYLAIFLLVLLSFLVLFAAAYIAVCLKSFTAPLDNIVRFDRKRQVACFWLEKRELFGNVHSFRDFVHIAKDDRVFVEVPWKDLTPGIYKLFGFTGNDYNPVLLAFDKNVESGRRDWKALRLIDGARCFIKLNTYGDGLGIDEDIVLLRATKSLEAIRSFMEDSYKSSIRPTRWRKLHRPDWRYMFNYLWPDQETGGGEEGIFSKIFSFGFEMFVLPVKVSTSWLYWLGMSKAPVPRFPEEIEKRNADDLKQLGVDQYGEPQSSPARFKEEGKNHDEIKQLKKYKRTDRILAIFTSVFIVFAVLSVADFLCMIVPDGRKYSLFNLLGIAPGTDQGYLIEILVAIFILYPICNAMALAIVRLSWPLMKKYNTDTVAWIPAKPLPNEVVRGSANEQS